MRTINYRSLINCVLFGSLVGVILLGSPARARPAAEMSETQPEAVGFSSERLRRFDAMMQSMVDSKEFAGIVTLAARHGKIFHAKTYGLRDVASGAPIQKDTIFRLASMTKPTTGVAMMILYEEGKWSPQDPISKYIPEFAELKVFKSVDPNGKMLLEDPAHPPTMRELMSHTAGFSYGAGDGPVDKLYKEAKPFDAPSLQEMINRLSKLPLPHQPGTRFEYSLSVDIRSR